MLEEFHDKSNIRRGLTHLVDQDHLSDHQRGEKKSDTETAHYDKGEPGNACSPLKFNDTTLYYKRVRFLNSYSCECEDRGKIGPNEGQTVDLWRLILKVLCGCLHCL